MYSIYTRFNEVFFFGLYALVTLCAINYLSATYMLKGKYIDASFEFANHNKFFKFENTRHRLQWDNLSSTFNLEVKKIRNLDNWNLKQVFIYLEMVWDEKGKRYSD